MPFRIHFNVGGVSYGAAPPLSLDQVLDVTADLDKLGITYNITEGDLNCGFWSSEEDRDIDYLRSSKETDSV